jgi:hypothetical protein
MRTKFWELWAIASLAGILAVHSANAQSAPVSPGQIEELQAQIKTLEREVQILKGRTTPAEKAYATAPPLTKAPAAPAEAGNHD